MRIQSFTWIQDQMVFVPDPTRIGFNTRSTFEELAVSRVSTEVRQCIAMQFTVSFNLPQVSYLTLIGWVFVVTYFCITWGS